MVDYYSIALAGFATGLGVVLASKFVNWLEKHPIIARFTSKLNSVSRGEVSLHDLMRQQRELGKKIEEKMNEGRRKTRPR